MSILRATLQLVYDFEFNADLYPDGTTIDQAVAIEQAAMEEDPSYMMSMEGVATTVSVTKIGE